MSAPNSKAAALTFFNSAQAALARAVSVDEVKTIRDQAEAARAYMRQAKASLRMQNQCAEIKLRAERRLGELLAKQVPSQGGRPKKRSHAGTVSRPTLEQLGINKNQSSRWQRIASIPARQFDSYLQQAQADDSDEELTTAGLLRASMRQTTVDAMASSETYEWYTPARYVDVARAVMGGIDLDPASSPIANRTIKAKRFYSFEQNGLAKRWSGRVWLNPPYGLSDDHRSNQAVWSEALLTRFEAGSVSQAVMLVNSATDAGWFQPLWAHPLCFVNHRIQFERPNGPGPQPTHGNVLVYLGRRVRRFARASSELGHIVLPQNAASVSLRYET